jgi:hypothetical protein
MEKTKEARANAAAPYKKPSDTTVRKCYNCNKEGHSTATCPEPWTEASKKAMAKKGITKQNKGKGKEMAAIAIASSSKSVSSSTSTTSQLDWVASLSSADVKMKDSDDLVSHHTLLPLFSAISDQDCLHVIDSGCTIHCTPYRDQLFNVHTTPVTKLTVANSDVLELQVAGDMRVDFWKNVSPHQSFLKTYTITHNSLLHSLVYLNCQTLHFPFIITFVLFWIQTIL